MTHTEKHNKALGLALARHFQESSAERVCACTGLTAVCIDCSYWWYLFLEKHNAEDMSNIMEMVLLAKRIRR